MLCGSSSDADRWLALAAPGERIHEVGGLEVTGKGSMSAVTCPCPQLVPTYLQLSSRAMCRWAVSRGIKVTLWQGRDPRRPFLGLFPLTSRSHCSPDLIRPILGTSSFLSCPNQTGASRHSHLHRALATLSTAPQALRAYLEEAIKLKEGNTEQTTKRSTQ